MFWDNEKSHCSAVCVTWKYRLQSLVVTASSKLSSVLSEWDLDGDYDDHVIISTNPDTQCMVKGIPTFGNFLS